MFSQSLAERVEYGSRRSAWSSKNGKRKQERKTEKGLSPSCLYCFSNANETIAPSEWPITVSIS